MMDSSGLLNSFLAAIQASLSVLLVIFYGGIAAWLNILTPDNTKAVSKICVRMFLPALLITQIGSELHSGSAGRYAIVLLWAIVCHLVSFVFGIVAHLGFGMPDWTTAALMFNNTTSYPLLLIAALDETGILSSLIVTDESTSAAIGRAKSYFLVFATVSSCLTFAVGPRLIDSEHAPEPVEDKDSSVTGVDELDHESEAGRDDGATERTRLLDHHDARSTSIQFNEPYRHNSFFPSTRKPSASAPRANTSHHNRRPALMPKKRWASLSPRTQWWIVFISDFFNAPLLGAIIGAIIGLAPPLHRAFFSDTADGGIFTAWLTASLKSIGGLFVPLPVVVAGVSLYASMQGMKRNSGSQAANAKLPWLPVIFVLVIRFVLWPVLSIGVIYVLASRTDVLGSDPMLWFTMMLMPTGPPAMKLITLVQISDAADEEDETVISKLLTISYFISPILSLTVVGSLKASQACIN
ncbi:Auxin efflux carrier superfamily [Mycena venus]|uniref:Auxin efflux carrier superfamily n=1 Tax=Mycena venus TaxID=2733690 RepID=A0A8H7CU11_9AGAR|nr:Auxin efflux carrier superfamily [Mycena venus]